MSVRSEDRGLLRRVIEAALDREEQGYPPVSANAAAAAQGNGTVDPSDLTDEELAKRLAPQTTRSEALIPVNDKLLVFRSLTGIDTVPALTHSGHTLRSARNVGIYTRVVTNEKKAGRAYRLFTWLMNTCLGVQIVVAAAVTALGAASGPHSAVTAFGAINTIMAGVLTYLRGAGLPDRLKTSQNKWKHIREYIEQREREFCLEGCPLDVQEEVFNVESMYQGLKSELETAKSASDGKTPQQPDDPRIRRSVLPGQQIHATPSRRADMLNAQQNTEQPMSPIAVPEPALEKKL